MQFQPRVTSYILGGVALSAVAVWLFWQPVAAQAAHWALQGYCRYCLGGSFTAEDVHLRHGELIFKNPSISDAASGESRIKGHAAEMRVGMQYSPFAGHGAVDVTFSSPRIEIISSKEKFAGPLSADSGWPVKVETSVSFDGGLLVFRDSATQHESHFAFEGSCCRQQTNIMLTSQNQGTLKCSCAGPDWSLSCSELSLSDLHHALRVLGMDVLPAHIHQGTINGEVSVEMDEEDLPEMWGALRIRECIFANTTGDVHGYLPEATLELNDSSLAGELYLGKGAYLEFAQEGKAPISLSQLEGKLSLPAYDRCSIKAEGLCTHHGSTYVLNVDGHVKVPGQEKASCELQVVLSGDSRQPVRACVSSYREGFGHSQCTLDVQNIGAGEWDLLMAALGTQDIGLDPYTLRDGLIDARIILGLENFRVRRINIEEFAAKHVAFDLDQSDTSVSIEHARGSLSLDLSVPNVLDSLQAAFGIDGGMVRFPALNKQQWQLSNLITKLTIENGAFKKSFVEADFMGLRGLIEVDWASAKAMNLRFQGDVRDLAALASSNVQRGVLKKFKTDSLSIVADVWRERNGLNVDGIIEVSRADGAAPELIQMGFTLEKTRDGAHRQGPNAAAFVPHLGADAVQAVVKQVVKPVDEPAAEWLKEELRIAGFTLKNGWFSAPNLPTDKYIEPFFFKEDQMTLAGNADFQGRFDCDGLIVEYQGEHIVLENDELAFDMGRIGLNQPATHYFDFIRDTDQGVVPVSGGTYFIKNNGLLFVDVEGSMLLKDKTIHIPAIETKCNHVYFAGMIDVDYSSPLKKVFDVEIETTAMEGTYSNVRDLLSHFNQTVSFVEMPLEGDISLTEAGSAFRFAFSPAGCDAEGTVYGKMQNGRLDTPFPGIGLQDISFDFDYDHAANKLNIKKINGRLNGKDADGNPFTIEGGYVHFLDLEEGLAEFDLPWQEGTREVFRLAGSTELLSQDEQEHLLRFLIDKKVTHYGGIHPHKFEAVMNNSCEVDAFDLQWNCDLAACFRDMHKVGAAALEGYAPKLAAQWGELSSPSGEIAVAVQYDNPSRMFHFHVEGQDISAGGSHFNNFVFAGTKRRHVWSIEQLQMDKIGIAADVEPQPDGYKVNFLGLRYGNMLLMGLEGFYSNQKSVFDGSINLMELDFSQLCQWKSFRELVSDYHPQGEMKGSGTLRIAMDGAWPPVVEANLKAMVRNSEIRGLHFEDVDNVSCEFVYQDRLVFRNCSSGFKCMDSGCTQGLFTVDTAHYDFSKEELSLKGLHFHTPAENLDWIAGNLERVFPEAFTPAIGKILRHVKGDDEAFQGSIDMQISDFASNVAMRLPQGKYKLGAKEHEVNNFALEWNGTALEVVTQYRFQNTLYWVTVKSSAPAIDAGDIYVSPYPPGHPRYNLPEDCLCIAWYMHPQHGMIVERASGTLPGVSVNLARDRQYPMNPHSWHLDGAIVLDPLVGEHILPPDIVEALDSWKISRDYQLNGKWIFMLEEPQEGELYFQGQLTGQDIVLKGYILDSISADLNCSPSRIDISNLVFKDACGSLSIESSSMVKQPDGQWWVYAPLIKGELFRPSLMREIDVPLGPPKPLVFPRFEIRDVACCADDLSTMTGTGRLDFNNSSKRPLSNPLLAIPAEIISRIGLNLDVLNPVSGTMFFDIEDYKVKLSKFKDVYSEGKLSKFYLPHNGYSSYVDLDGNVHVQVRMKQYNLLFKLAELFTVTIHGTLQKPIYTLQKQ